MTSPPPLRLYELVLANGISMSPFVWRVKYALAFKGLAAETVPVGFTQIRRVLGGRFPTVPILELGDEAVCDSWAIVDRLEAAFPDRPRLFGSPGERALAQFFDEWFMPEVSRRLLGLYALDICNAARAEDRDYFRKSREARFGMTLEAFVAGREERLPALREAMSPLRRVLAHTPFLGGAAPNYADFIAWSSFLWAATVATLPPLAADDPLIAWLDRGFDLHGGIGRDPRLKPLAEAAPA